MQKYIIEEDCSKFGWIVVRQNNHLYLDENGLRNKKSILEYNFVTNRNELVSEKWAQSVTADWDDDNCILMFKKDDDELERVKKIPKYIFSSGAVYPQYTYKYGSVNKDGELIVPLLYDKLSFNNLNSFTAEYNGKMGYLDSVTGDNITGLIFNEALEFDPNSNLAYVEANNYKGYIDRFQKFDNKENQNIKLLTKKRN